MHDSSRAGSSAERADPFMARDDGHAESDTLAIDGSARKLYEPYARDRFRRLTEVATTEPDSRQRSTRSVASSLTRLLGPMT